jgi:hypothetical protein
MTTAYFMAHPPLSSLLASEYCSTFRLVDHR